jgi:hypothetical protein
VADEASIPTFIWQHFGADESGGASNQYNFNFEYDKRITYNTAIIFNDGYSLIQQQGAKTRNGWQNLFVTLKWESYVNAEHEFIMSLGVIRQIARTGTARLGNDDVGSTTPTLYFGKGLGDLPIGWARPFAVTGTFGYTISDKKVKSVPVVDPDTGLVSFEFNNGVENRWVGGLSLQYSIPYLQSQVRDLRAGVFWQYDAIGGGGVVGAGQRAQHSEVAGAVRGRGGLHDGDIRHRRRGADPGQSADRHEYWLSGAASSLSG